MAESSNVRFPMWLAVLWREGRHNWWWPAGKPQEYASGRSTFSRCRSDRKLIQAYPGAMQLQLVNSASGLHLALKSGNFGSRDFFTRAFTLLE